MGSKESRYRGRDGLKELQRSIENDPPLGLPLSKIFKNFQDIKLTTYDKPLLVCVFQTCEGCSGRIVQDWLDAFEWDTLRNELRLVLIIQDNPEKVKNISPNVRKSQILIIADPYGKIVKTLNSVNFVFTPRVYGFIEGKLVWIQKEPGQVIVSVLQQWLEVSKGKNTRNR